MQTQNRPLIQPRMIMTPAERQMGRFMRAPDGHDGGSSQQPLQGGPRETNPGGENNSGGNNGQSGGQPRSQNNSGDEFDPISFWDEGGDDEEGPDNRQSAPTPSPSPTPSSTPTPSANPGQQMLEEIRNLSFDEVFTTEVTTELNEGKFEKANELITKNLRSGVESAFRTTVKLLTQFSEVNQRQMQAMIDERLTGEKQSDALVKAIPSAANPKVGPAIRAIYQPALRRAKGDTTKAISATKAMMQTLSSETADDLGFEVAPRDPHAPRTRTAPATNWLESLTSR